MNIRTPKKAGISQGENTAVPDQKTGVKSRSDVVQPDDWLCAVCRNKIASDKERFFYDDSSEFDFINPGGEHFHIITFSPSSGCKERGVPTMEHTWFDGHKWAMAHCGQCGLQLGWKYTGQYSFHGLIRLRLVPGFSALN